MLWFQTFSSTPLSSSGLFLIPARVTGKPFSQSDLKRIAREARLGIQRLQQLSRSSDVRPGSREEQCKKHTTIEIRTMFDQSLQLRHLARQLTPISSPRQQLVLEDSKFLLPSRLVPHVRCRKDGYKTGSSYTDMTRP